MDQVLNNKFRSSDIFTVINVRILECLGHVVRMNVTRRGKKLLDGKPEGGIKKRRPRIRWTDVDESYLSNMEQELLTEQIGRLS
jgi:hypothetical protein